MVAATRIALLVATNRFPPPCAPSSAATPLPAVDLPTVTAAAHVEYLAALAAPRLSKAVLRLVAVFDALMLLTAGPSASLHGFVAKELKMSRKKPRSPKGKPFQPRRSVTTEGQKLDELARDAAGVFTCATKTAESCAAECEQRVLDVEGDLEYRSVAAEIWREHTGATGHALVSAMADLIAENERHHDAIAELFERFETLAAQQTHEHIAESSDYFELVRTRLFPDDSAT